MSDVLYPVVYVPTLDERRSAVRALYALGFRRYGCVDVEEGVQQINARIDSPYLYLSSSRLSSHIGFMNQDEVARDRSVTKVNSIAHMVAYIRRMGIKP